MNNVENGVCACVLLEEFLGSGCLKFHGVHSCVSAECALVRAAITRGHRKTEGSLLINEENRRREKIMIMVEFTMLLYLMLRFI